MPELDRDEPPARYGGPAQRADGMEFVGHGDPRCFRPGVEAHLHARDGGTPTGPVPEPDGEGRSPGQDRSPAPEQFAGPGGMTGHQGLAPLRQNEHPACRVAGSVTAPVHCHGRCVSSGSGVPPTGPGAVPVDLPSPMFHVGARRSGRESASRFVPAPGGVCAHGFQSRLLRKHSLVGLLTCGERSHRGTSSDPRIVMTGAGHSVRERVTSLLVMRPTLPTSDRAAPTDR